MLEGAHLISKKLRRSVVVLWPCGLIGVWGHRKLPEMASSASSHLRVIDEQFCQCSICLQQYREPKQLPCLHRYCSDCLKQLIERNQGVTVISCPECRDEVRIPTEGVDGFKTDFYMKNIIEYIKIQKSVEDEESLECYDCSRIMKATAYCFKCTGVLCQECHGNHMTKRTLKDHKQHTLSLEDLKSKHMTLETVTDLMEAPRCQSHLKDVCLLCCLTCSKLPICVTCTYGSHKNHDINDVGLIAAEERERLKHELKDIGQYEERLLQIPKTVANSQEEIVCNVKEKKESLRTRYDREMQKIQRKTQKMEQNFQFNQIEIEKERERKLVATIKQKDEKLKEIQKLYDRMCEDIKEDSKVSLKKLRQEHQENLAKNEETLVLLEKECNSFIEAYDGKLEEHIITLQEILHKVDFTRKQYESLVTTGNSVLKTRSEWTAVQRIPDICEAIKPLREDMKKEFPELNTPLNIKIYPAITEDEESPVNIEGIKTNNWRITSMASSGHNIVITGKTSADYQSHITVINMKGKGSLRDTMQSVSVNGYRYCSTLSEFNIATACWPNEIGIFDIRDSSYIKRNISDVNSSWPASRKVRCVAIDVLNSHILVGGNDSGDVYVFDDQLNYHQTLTLPEMIKYPHDMVVMEGNLLVCDYVSRKAFVVITAGEQGCKILHEFPKPDFHQEDWSPLSVCTDSNFFIYILWSTGENLNTGRRVVGQYSQDDCHLLKTKQLHVSDAKCITTMLTHETEKLLVATWKSGELYIYSLT